MKTVFKSLCLFLCCSIASYAQSQDVALAQGEKMMQNHRAAFEENKGQVTGEDAQKVRYFYKEGSLSMFLLPTGIAYQFNQTHYPDGYKHLDKFAQPEEREKMEELAKNIRIETYRMDIELLGANPNPRISTDGKSQDYTQYYNHNALNVHNYSKITYHEVYPNIDWVIYKTDKALKYDFVVRAGGNPAQIQLKTNWVEDLQINADGGITLKNRMGNITEQSPVSFQADKTISTQFKLENNVLSFAIANYDPNQTLIIDPTLLWATYYGGTSIDYGQSCAVDASGNVYLAGYTESATNIASGGHQNTYGGGGFDAFLVKFNSVGVRQWATYYGSDMRPDYSWSCAVDAAGNLYLGGHSLSISNIASGGHQNTISGSVDAFLAKFDSAGIRQWATYYGGTGNDIGYSCVIDALGNVYLAGQTVSTTNIASGGHQNTHGGGTYDAFLVKFNSAGIRQWGTYYGGTSADYGRSCVTDTAGNVYLAGYTESTTNIASNGHQNTLGGSNDAFLVKFNSAGTRQWATYYGGTGEEYGYSCAVDALGNVYLAGETRSTSNIASSGHQNTIGGGIDAFLVKFNSAGVRQWATYYGGTGDDRGYSCTLDGSGNIYLAGETQSTSNIASGGHQNTAGGGTYDAFLVKFNSAGVRQWATYYGGSSGDFGWSCAVDSSGNVYLAGRTNSSSNIASGGHQNTFGGGVDAFLVKFRGTACVVPTVTITQSGTTLQATAGYTSYVWSLNGTIISSATSSSHTATANGDYQVTVTDANGCQNTTTINYTASNINQISSADFVKIFPNPSEGIVNIHFAQDGEKVINIYDNLGRLVYQNQFDQLQNQISIQDLSNGVYQVQIIQSNAQMTKSLIIAK
jgi:hypothetical protein